MKNFFTERISDRTCLTLIFLLSLLPCFFLLKGHLLSSGVDMETAFIKVIALMECWKQGDLLGRWTADVYFGYGHPLLNFYSPLSFYFGAVVAWVVQAPVLGFNIAVILTFFLSGAAMYYFCREFWPKEGAFLSGVAYMYAPYRVWDIYARGASAEAFSAIFLPLVLMSLWRIHRRFDVPSAFLGMFAISGMVLSHNLMTMVVFFVALAYFVFLLLTGSAQNRWRFFLLCLAAATGALAMTAYFWMPVVAEKQFVTLFRALGGVNIHHELLDVRQLFGYAVNVPYRIRPSNDWPLWVCHALMAVFCCIFWMKIRSFDRRAGLHMSFWLGVALGVGYLMLNWSQWIWDAFPGMVYFQFPWRLLFVIDLVLCFFIGAIIVVFPRKFLRQAVVIVVLILLLGTLGFCRLHGQARDLGGIRDWKGWLFQEKAHNTMEFLPIWIKKLVRVPPGHRFDVFQGKGALFFDNESAALRKRLYVKAETSVAVVYHHFYFPGWTVRVDGVKTRVFFENDLGLIFFVVPAGEHRVVVSFERTPVRVVGEAVSAVAWIVFLGYICFLAFRRTKPAGLVDIPQDG